MTAAAERAAAQWLVAGRVQGVGFRWFVARQASELGLAGWVKNLPDGRVEVVAAGPAVALAQMDGRLRKGPRMARVENVEKYEIPHQTIAAISFDVM